MMVWSVWQKKGVKVVIETLVAETADQHEAESIFYRLQKQGMNVRLAGPHESIGVDSDFPLEY